MRLCGRVADGWGTSSGWAGPDRLPELNARIDSAAAEAGREPQEIRRLYNVNGVVTGGRSAGFLHGPVDQWVEELTELVLEQGMDTFVYWSSKPDEADRAGDVREQLRRFAEQVAHAVREEVAKGRG